VTTTIDEGFCLPKVEKFEELINERTKAILICNPNNRGRCREILCVVPERFPLEG